LGPPQHLFEIFVQGDVTKGTVIVDNHNHRNFLEVSHRLATAKSNVTIE